MQPLPPGSVHYYNRRFTLSEVEGRAVLKPPSRLGAGSDLAPALPLALTKFYGAKSAKNMQKTTFKSLLSP